MSRLLTPGVLAQRRGIKGPSQIITDGRDWAWYDPSDLSTLAQNSDGTTAVAVGDPVGYAEDKSGNTHLVTGSGTARPVLGQTAGGLYYFDFDGDDDYLQTADDDVSWVGDYLAVAALSADVLRVQQFVSADQVNQLSGSKRKAQLLRSVATGEGSSVAFNDSGTNFSDLSGVTPAANEVFVASARADSSGLECWVNRSSNGSTAITGTLAAMATRLVLGARADIRNYFNGQMFGAVVVNGSSTTAERNQLEDYIASKSGVTL
jgi:hypothetical protein